MSPEAVAPLGCPKCRRLLAATLLQRDQLAPCPVCGALLQVEVFPALFRPPAPGRQGETLVLADESSCFYHPQKKAAVPCDHCGRFLCALCDCELDGKHYCPGCLEAGRKAGRLQHLEHARTLYGNVALALAFYPLLIFYVTILTAPAALVVALRFWNAPRSLVRPGHGRHIAAIILAGCEIVGWGVLIYFLTTAKHRTHG